MKRFTKAIAAIMLMMAVVCVVGCKKPSNEKRIIRFSFTTPSVTALINESDKTIEAIVPSGTNVRSLTPAIIVSDKATVYPASGVSRDFTNPVTYTVTAEDGSQSVYTVTVTIGVMHTVAVSANPVTGGTVTGGGSYESGETCTVSAVANSGYIFNKWMENGTQVSSDADYTFTVNNDRNLVAKFTIDGGGGSGGGGTEQGMYVGVIGFNDALNTKEISLLNSSSESSFTSFINGLWMDDNTALYYADETALNWLQTATLPSDLINVSLLTFTDGLDNASLMLNSSYSSQEAYLNAIHNRILSDRVQGKPINAYSIGLRGNNVIDEEDFRQKLMNLASSNSNFYLADNMELVIQRFREIASQLYNEITTVNTNVKIPGGYDNNTTIRLTFDNVSDPVNSSSYIQAVFSRDNGNGKLSYVEYHGLQSTSGTTIISSEHQGASYWYTFSELKNEFGVPINNLDNMKLWIYAPSGWRPEDEFTPSSYTNTTVTQKSAVAILVLDCTTSLGTEDFRLMKNAATEFIQTLNNSGGGGGGWSQTYSVSVSANPSNGGTVSGGGTYTYGQSCTVYATANSGYTFANWTENGSVVSSSASYTFTLDRNRNLVANFTVNAQPTYTITTLANPTDGGTVTGGGTYNEGTSVTLRANANTNYTFDHWQDGNTANPRTITVTANATYTAYFIDNGGSGGNANGHAYVDLGLPSGTLWATCNVGATTSVGYGNYYAWGETTTKTTYKWTTYRYCNGSSNTLTKYCNDPSYGNNGFTDNLTTLQFGDDAARANWGGDWRMPTKAEWEELKSNTTVTWTTQNGVQGRKFTSSNGNSLFLPAAGCRIDGNLNYVGVYGLYWSSSLYTNSPHHAYELYISSVGCYIADDIRYCGYPIRAVLPASKN